MQHAPTVTSMVALCETNWLEGSCFQTLCAPQVKHKVVARFNCRTMIISSVRNTSLGYHVIASVEVALESKTEEQSRQNGMYPNIILRANIGWNQ